MFDYIFENILIGLTGDQDSECPPPNLNSCMVFQIRNWGRDSVGLGYTIHQPDSVVARPRHTPTSYAHSSHMVPKQPPLDQMPQLSSPSSSPTPTQKHANTVLPMITAAYRLLDMLANCYNTNTLGTHQSLLMYFFYKDRCLSFVL